MRSLYRQIIHVACLATLTVIVLVACSSGPGIAAPTVGEGAPGSVDFDAGQKTEPLALSEVFTGENLTFSDPRSSRPAVATASILNGTLTITAVSPGEATITVTATNAGGNVSHEITVTVPEPVATSAPTVRAGAPDSVAFDQGQTTRTVSLMSSVFTGDNLTFSDPKSSKPAVATASIANGILTITAVSPGEATITVTATNAGGNVSHEIAVTVPQTSGPAAPTVRAGAPASVEFDQGQTTRTVSLRGVVFTGENLTFDIESDTPSVAIASISNGILIITAGDPGEATITVTATNTRGRVSHEITVTVPGLITTPPTTTPTNTTSSCKSPLTIKLHATAKCTLSSKEQILRSDSDGVTVVRSPAKDTEWSIRAEKKGPHKVSIIGTGASNSGEKLGEITVEVPNSHPILKEADQVDIVIQLASATPASDTGTDDLSPPSAYFSDPDDEPEEDGIKDVKYYRIASKPGWFLIDTENGFVKDYDNDNNGYQLRYEVLKEVKEGVERPEYEFTVSLYGSDGEDDSTLPLVLKFNAPSGGLHPRDVAYSLNQRGDKNNFYNDVTLDAPPANKLDVGPRRGVSHTVTFTGATGFGFADSLHQKWENDEKLESIHSVTTETADTHYLGEDGNYVPSLPKEQGEANSANRAEGTDYFILKSTGAVAVKRATVSGAPVVEFELKETGSSGTIKIEYYVWVLSRDQKTTADGVLDSTGDPRDEIPTTRRSDSRTLTINVVSCSSPPDPIAACP